MDTVLNLGWSDEVLKGMLKRRPDNHRWVYDCYRRFIMMYGDVVLGMDREPFEDVIKEIKAAKKYVQDTDMKAEDWKEVAEKFKAMVPFPPNPKDQLLSAVRAVFDSWHTPRAKRYRMYNDIPDDLGTAVNVQGNIYRAVTAPVHRAC